MIKRFFSLLVFTCVFAVMSAAQKPIGIGQWRTHLPYNSVYSIAEAPGILYVASEASFYSFALNTGEIELFSKVDGFSDVEISKLAYYWEKDLLFIGYKNTNIDLLINGKTIVNIPEVFRETIVGEKEINDVYFYKNIAYVSTSFGIIEVDIAKFEIKGDYRRIGPMGQQGKITPVSSTCVLGGVIYATTPDGVVKADIDANLSDANSWTLELASISSFGGGKMIDYNGEVYATVDTILRVYDGNTWDYFNGLNQRLTASLDVNRNKLVVVQTNGIWLVDQNGNKSLYDLQYMNYATIDKSGYIWTGGNGTGLIVRDDVGETGYIQPNGPVSISSFAIRQFNGDMWVLGGGVTPTWSPAFNNSGVYRFANGVWYNFRKDKPSLLAMRDFISMSTNEGTNEMFLGTHAFGLAHIKNGQVQAIYNENNSSLRKDLGGFVRCPGVALDEGNNLWVTNFNEDANLESLSVRKANGSWKKFTLPDGRAGKLIIDEDGQKWMTSPNNGGIGIMVFKELNGIDGKDTRSRILTTGERSGDLPSNRVNVLLLDEDGEIWVGTEEGLAIFYNPSNVFEGGLDADAQQIIIDDGKDIGYLLGTEVINDMALDGANRKWVATNTGVWLIEEDGSKVLKHFTIRNSPLLSNTVNCVGIDQKTGEVYFGTDKGIISYRGDATEAGEFHGDVVVFPNPVRENYHGVITITGLPRNATVKIADVAGRVVYEMVSDGGTAVWNGLSFSGERPATGVYLIFTANENDEDALVSKLLIVN